MMTWIPVPGIGAGIYEKGANFSNYIDRLALKGPYVVIYKNLGSGRFDQHTTGNFNNNFWHFDRTLVEK